jgi:cell division protein FtsQ
LAFCSYQLAKTIPAQVINMSKHDLNSKLERRRKLRWFFATFLVISTVVTLWFAVPIRSIEVKGNHHLSKAQVCELAGLTPGFSWIYYGPWRARGIKANSWIRSAKIIKRFPQSIEVRLIERKPFANWQRPDGNVVTVAEDNTMLPDAENVKALPTLQGWGPSRLSEAILVARALARYNVKSVVYTPSGVVVHTAQGTVWSGDLRALVKYAGAIVQFPSKRIFIYPWGVSVQQ